MEQNKKSTIVAYIYTVFVAASMSRLFGLGSLIAPHVYFNDLQYMILLFVSIVFIIIQILFVDKLRIRKMEQYRSLWYFFMILIAVEMFSSVLQYGSSGRMILKDAMYYYTPMLSYYCFYSMSFKTEIVEVIKKVIVISALLVTIVSIIEYVFLLRGNDILQLGTSISVRYGSPRYNLASILYILGFLISFGQSLEENREFRIFNKYGFISIIILFNLIFVAKGRSLVVYLLIASCIALIVSRKISRGFKSLLIVMVVLLVAGLAIFKLPTVIATLTNTDAGVAIRIDEVKYYFNQITMHPLLGMGFVPSTSNLTSGPYGMYYQSDVGLLGVVNKFGLLMLVWIICWFVRSVMLLARGNYYMRTGIISIMLLTYLFISNVSLSFLDYNKTMIIPIAMILFENQIRYRGQKDAAK
ncbi:hypothetical protein [Lacticaseibacillus sp. N501-2]|uniref:hypothetical protein n=1 Tax=Lacticaseibacillus salsurae TaxID=3367729 RepID=UPI0038B41076